MSKESETAPTVVDQKQEQLAVAQTESEDTNKMATMPSSSSKKSGNTNG